jgi:hypothetical protein
VSCQLPRRGNADAQALAELDLRADRKADERRDRRVATTVSQQRALELGVGAVERLVAPVVTAAGFGDVGQERQEDRPQQRRLAVARMGGGVDGRRRLTAELLDRDPGVGQRSSRSARVHVRAHERSVLVERGLAARGVLLEGERNLGAALHVPHQERKPREAEAAERAVQVGRACGHACDYAPDGSFPVWQPGHQ